MTWRYTVRLVTHDDKTRSAESDLSREEMLQQVETLVDHVGNEYRVEITTYDPDDNP